MAENKITTQHQRVPITLRDLFWQDPFFSSNWEDFHQLHDEMMQETRNIWQKFDEKIKHQFGDAGISATAGSLSPFQFPQTPTLSKDDSMLEMKTPGWIFPRKLMRLPSIFNEERSKDMLKDEQQISLKDDEKQFQISLDTSNFRPDEIKVTVDPQNILTVEADHEEKAEDGSKHVSRKFMRKYTLPRGCRMASVVSNLSSDGVLMITAPKNVSIEAAEAKNVPIQLQKDQS